ncbi:response regulator [Clostridium sardiniense]|uniref:response regulator n=1 Tax=Clostridium sardiniense TaxID=29369 RepID=UPI003D3578A7
MYRILIVDDDPLMRQALNLIISKVEGFEVAFSVGSGEEAVELCKNNKIDIVFIDIMLSGESGIESSKKIYLYNPKTTIYIMSSYSSFDFAIEALKIKVKAYITKPISFSKIKDLLDDYLIENKEEDKSSFINEEDELEELFKIINEKDFKRAYYKIPKFINKIYEKEDVGEVYFQKYFNELGNKLVAPIEILKNKTIDINELFPINNLFTSNKKAFELWLFNVVNYIFKEQSIKKYSLLETVFDYIEENIEEEIGLNDVIKNCTISQGYLSRIFKRQFNVSIMEYIHMRKIYMAKYYFSFTDLNVTDIAFKLGYNESGYFSKVFKRYENITIHQYKKML